MNEKDGFLKRLIGATKKNFGPVRYKRQEPRKVQGPVEPSFSVPSRGVTLDNTDIKTLRSTLFSEVSNRNSEKQKFEARIIANTALNRIGQYAARGKELNLAGVLAAPNQYQGYGGKEYNRFVNGSTTPVDNQKIQAIDEVINEIKSGNFNDNTNNSVFYIHNPDGSIKLKPGGLYK